LAVTVALRLQARCGIFTSWLLNALLDLLIRGIAYQLLHNAAQEWRSMKVSISIAVAQMDTSPPFPSVSVPPAGMEQPFPNQVREYVVE
jgi:hypothetical protein